MLTFSSFILLLRSDCLVLKIRNSLPCIAGCNVSLHVVRKIYGTLNNLPCDDNTPLASNSEKSSSTLSASDSASCVADISFWT